MTLAYDIHQARSLYISAAVAEANAICNVLESTKEDLLPTLREKAEEAGTHAQESFERFVSLLQTRELSQENAN
jgi:hypothetical protein